MDTLERLVREHARRAGGQDQPSERFFERLRHLLANSQKWSVVGAFPGDAEHAALNRPFPPESSIDLDATYDQVVGPFPGWRRAEVETGQYVDLLRQCQAREGSVVAYAVTYVRTDAEQQVTLRFGSDDGARIWLENEEIFEFDGIRAFAPAEDEVRITLRPGLNKLLVKVANASGDWGFAVDLIDADGWPAKVGWSANPAERDMP